MFADQTLAGIIRISPDFGSELSEGQTLADLFEGWGNDLCYGSHPLASTNRLIGSLAGPRQHKVRANLEQIRAELELELAGFSLQRKATS